MDSIHSWIYKSLKQDELYVYLAEIENFQVLPEALSKKLGKLQFVIDLDLSTSRPLAKEDVSQVMTNLAANGFHLQLPSNFTPQLFYGE